MQVNHYQSSAIGFARVVPKDIYSLFSVTYDFFNLAHINEKIYLSQRAKFLTLSLNIFPACR